MLMNMGTKRIWYVICLCVSISIAAPRSHILRHRKKVQGDKANLVLSSQIRNETDAPKKQYVPAIMIVQNLGGSNAPPSFSNFPPQQNLFPGFPLGLNQAMNYDTSSHFGGLHGPFQMSEPAIEHPILPPCAHSCSEVHPILPKIPSLKPVVIPYAVPVETVAPAHKIFKPVQVASLESKPAVVEVSDVKPVPPLIDPSEGERTHYEVAAVEVTHEKPIDGIVTIDHKPVPAVITRPVSVSAPATGHQNQTFTIGLDFKADGDIHVDNFKGNFAPNSLPLRNPNPPVEKDGNFELTLDNSNFKEGDMTPVSKASDEAEANKGIVKEVSNILQNGVRYKQDSNDFHE